MAIGEPVPWPTRQDTITLADIALQVTKLNEAIQGVAAALATLASYIHDKDQAELQAWKDEATRLRLRQRELAERVRQKLAQKP